MLKVAVHNRPYVTLAGYEAPRWRRYYVYVGSDPEGPMGGRQGRCVKGKCMFGPFINKADAETKATEYAAKNGYELI